MTKEELYNYYIVENHSRVDTAMFFNVTEDQLKFILAKFRIIKKQRGVIRPVTWTVYRHVNKINGKCYVGITNQRYLRCRWGPGGNRYHQDGQKKFWSAIVKYGWNNFDHEVLEENIQTPQEANEREQYWIAYYDSFKHGYNATTGGSGATGHVVTKEQKRKMGEVNIGNKHHVQKHSEETKKIISERNKGKHLNPRTEFKKGNKSWLEGRVGEFGKPVLQYDVNGNFVKEWLNIYSVVKFFNGEGGKSETCIRCCCKGTRKRYKGFLWRYKENNNFPLKIETPVLIDVRRPVLQFDMDNNFISEYESTIEASRQTGATRLGIADCCKGKYKQAGGYIWRYKK